MDDKKKKVFVEPELIKFDKPLSEVTMDGSGTNNGGMTQIDPPSLV